MVAILKFGDLIAEGEYKLYSNFRNHLNYLSNRTLMTLTDKASDAGPVNINLSTLSFPLPEKINLSTRKLILNDQAISLAANKEFCSHLELTRDEVNNVLSSLQYLQDKILKNGSNASLKHLLKTTQNNNIGNFQIALLDKIENSFHLLLKGEIKTGIKGIKGRGLGLTPAGDDFITGLLYGLHLLQFKSIDLTVLRREIYQYSLTGNLFSENYLLLAYRGRYFADLKNLILALISNNNQEIDRCLRTLLQKGATSGADLLTGLILTLEYREQILKLYER